MLLTYIVVTYSRVKEPDEYPTALNGFLYSLLRVTKPQRRALALSILKQFDEHAVSVILFIHFHFR